MLKVLHQTKGRSTYSLGEWTTTLILTLLEALSLDTKETLKNRIDKM